ncbi:hypothetical protein [Prochlorococcus marinus]|uniref:Uncharacterized protein n=1 Tax=Prochlorococcus marinus (strain MIT 9211) TaxID=93059 RepID=A9BA73_PROM4|nr:hypothetical protein [Prochlorococcus marinus]ABX08735.1 Hypothetical protein P9211_08041 [Prochlorococcus marinus str. MIT 9211]
MNNLLIQSLLLIVGSIGTIAAFWYLFSSNTKTKKSFISKDGTSFRDQESCDNYEVICERFTGFFDEEALRTNKKKNDLTGLRIAFIKLLKSDGFQDVKTMIKYKDDFRKLADLFELDSVA